MIQRCYEEGFSVDTITADLDETAVEVQSDTVDVDFESVESLVEGSPVINLVNYFIVQAIRQGASDIHIEPTRNHTVVRFRVDGQLREVLRPRRDIHPALVSRIKVMGKMDIAEHRLPQDGRLHVVVEGREIDLRVSTLPTVLGEKVVLRVLDRRRLTFNLDHLGLPQDMLQQTKQMLAKPYGLLLVTGPTGSGKTTTLYSAIELIKSVHRNIVTVEDPVEYQLELINQVQVRRRHALTFAAALRSILRQDPDVIMVGEIRDAETAAGGRAGRAHRPPGAQHAAHQRQRRRRHAAGRHGRRALQGRRGAGGRHGPAARADGLPATAVRRTIRRPTCWT